MFLHKYFFFLLNFNKLLSFSSSPVHTSYLLASFIFMSVVLSPPLFFHANHFQAPPISMWLSLIFQLHPISAHGLCWVLLFGLPLSSFSSFIPFSILIMSGVTVRTPSFHNNIFMLMVSWLLPHH